MLNAFRLVIDARGGVFLDQGQVVEEGNRDKLLSGGRLFAGLHRNLF